MAAIGQTVKTGRQKKYPTQKKLNGSTTRLKNLQKYPNQASIGSIMEATKKYLRPGGFFSGIKTSGMKLKPQTPIKPTKTNLMR